MNCDVMPPAGYRLATREEEQSIPKGALFLNEVGHWKESLCNGTAANSGYLYAVPVITADPKATDIQVGGSHYKGLVIQPAEYCQRNRLPYCEANVVKYVTRHREKNGREDVEKAIHYLQLLLEIEYPKP